MNCQEYQTRISAQMDGQMAPAESAEAERHVGSCPRCSAVFMDLKQIVTQSHQLPLFEPHPRLWARIRTQLEEEQLIQTSPSWLTRWSEAVRIPSLPRMAVGTSIAVLLVLGASVWVGRGIWFGPVSPGQPAAPEIQAANEVKLAEQHYLDAIGSLAKITEGRMEQMDPALKGVLEDNLATIDYYIDKCRETVKNDPTNALAQRYLLEAYRKKVDLLESIIHSDVL